ncbi:MAG TPA: FAD-dependent oxidoreductase, partial [Thermosynergistes sp.]|nr:FAD-dependent oxidoreductase [Thermosynergistes sp.]
MKVARFIISLSLCAMSLAWTLPAPAVEELSYDVVVAGGGAGGSAAAIQAARLGASVAIIEETGTIGGQMTAAAVSTMDDMYGNRSGLYGEFIDKVKACYDEKGKSLGTCYWSPITIAFEPHIGEAVLYEMIEETRNGKGLTPKG